MTTVPLAHDVHGDPALPAVVLLHGYPLSRAIWEPVIPRLAKARRVVAPDLRGHGATPSGKQPPSMDDLARDVLALADQLGLRTFGLAGHSMGGYVALALLRLAPGRVDRLALVATKAGADSEEAKQGRRNQQDLVQRRGTPALAEVLLPKMLAPTAPRELREEVRRLMEGTPVSGVVDTLNAMMMRPDSTPGLAAIRVPTLVVAGGEDQLMPRAELDKLAREIPGARLEVVDGAGHLPMMERPDRVAELLAAHFSAR